MLQEANGSCSDDREFRRRLQGLVRRVGCLGVHGQAAEDLALSMLVVPRSPLVVRTVSGLDSRSRTKTFLQSERRRRRHECAAARLRLDAMEPAEAWTPEEQREAERLLKVLLEEAAREIPRKDLQVFSHRLLAHWRTDPGSVLTGGNLAVREVFAALLRRHRVQVTDLRRGPGFERILLESLTLWAAEGKPPRRHRRKSV